MRSQKKRFGKSEPLSFCDEPRWDEEVYPADLKQIDSINRNFAESDISEKMKCLLAIAASVQESGKRVTAEQIANAKANGATDKEIHDTVLIAAAFCMYNKYVDGLNTWAPQDKQVYVDRAPMRAREGYINSIKK